jgi:hypothetical protein
MNKQEIFILSSQNNILDTSSDLTLVGIIYFITVNVEVLFHLKLNLQKHKNNHSRKRGLSEKLVDRSRSFGIYSNLIHSLISLN